jgi:hypothetical protein
MIRLRRQVRLVFRKSGERSHASAAFLAVVDERETAKKEPAAKATKIARTPKSPQTEQAS